MQQRVLPRSLTRAQEARRQRVIDAAMELGLEGGYEAVQMRDVAARAHVAMGTVYRYFSSKDHLLAAALVFWVEQLDARLAQVPARGSVASERVLDVLERALRAMGRQPQLVAAVFASLASPDVAAIECQQQMGAVMDGIIIRAIGEPQPPDHAERTRIIGHVWYSSLVGWVNGWSDMDRVRDELAVAVRLLLPTGLVPNGQSTAASKALRTVQQRGRYEQGRRSGRRGDVAAHSGAWSNAQAGSAPGRHGRPPGRELRMRAAIFNEVGKEVIDIYDDVEVADPGPGEVRLKLHAAGVCHSDLSAMNGTLPQPAPAVLGHEGAGEIIEVGPGVDQVAVGDHVIVAWTPPCGKCAACLRGEANLCVDIFFNIAGAGQVLARWRARLRLRRHGNVRRGDGAPPAGRGEDPQRRALRDRRAHRLRRDHRRRRRAQHRQGEAGVERGGVRCRWRRHRRHPGGPHRRARRRSWPSTWSTPS